MKTTLATLTLCLVALVATGFPFERKGGAGTKEKQRVQYAGWDDVNVIAHGLLQLGQGLKEHVDKTKVQMRDISAKLRAYNGTVTELGKAGQRVAADGEALRARVRGLEDREGQVLNVTAAAAALLREKAGELEEEQQRGRKVVMERMTRLEERVDAVALLQGKNGPLLPDTNAAVGNYSDAGVVQVMLETQNRRIDDLVERIQLQQDKLDKQNVRIRTLQNQIQLTKERAAFKASRTDTTKQNGSVEQRDSPIEMASNCHEVFLRGETSSGVYTIQPSGGQSFEVFCEMTAEGGWTVIQRRQDGSVDFDQLWQAYQKGFGSLNGEFWLGLEKIHSLSKDGDYILKIQFSDWKEDSDSLRLRFRLGGEETKYTLHVQDTVGNLESSLATGATSSGLPFSTRDQDNDQKPDTNCAKHLSGGWWFSNCGQSNLNGRYFQSPPPKQRHQRKQGVFWKTWRGRYYPLKTTAMMVAPAEIGNKS